MKLTLLCVVFVFFFYLSMPIIEVFCGDGTFGQFPPGLISDVVGELANKTVDDVGMCSDPKKTDYRLLFYTRRNTAGPILLTDTNLRQLSPKKKTMLIIHGYFSSPESLSFFELKSAYLIRYDCNVIILDWSYLARPRLTTASCYLPKLAPLLAGTLCLSKLSLKNFHIIGHSLGAQMAGMIGSNTIALCHEKVGRITAMDPGGPFYPEFPKKYRLDKSDAFFVDVIHSNAGGIGFWGNTGHADFYVNCGSIQPGCQQIDMERIMNYPFAFLACSHYRSVEYMTESVNSKDFQAKPCRTCPFPCVPDLPAKTQVVMGENCPSNTSGAFVLSTKSEAPYVMG